MASTMDLNVKFIYKGRGPGHVTLVENLVTAPINQTAEVVLIWYICESWQVL